MDIMFEKEVCQYLGIPSIPLKEWDGTSPFTKAVAVLSLAFGKKAYGVARFEPTKESEPNIVKVFNSEPFVGIEKLFVVPEYMETSVEDADLDDESKKKAEELAHQGDEIINAGKHDDDKALENPPTPYYFDNITSDEEAIAFIAAYNKKNKTGGRVPKTHDTILMRLAVIYADQKKASGVE